LREREIKRKRVEKHEGLVEKIRWRDERREKGARPGFTSRPLGNEASQA